LNPRRPTPSGPEPDPLSTKPNGGISQSGNGSQGFLKQRLGITLSQTLLSEFEGWCSRKASREVCRQYINKLKDIDSGAKGVESSRWHITAYKRFAKFLCEVKGNSRACQEFKKVKSRRSNPDLYVPSEEEMKKALVSPIGWFYRYLLESGLRAVEVVKVLTERLRFVDKGDFVRFELNWKRGAKRAYWAYFIEFPELMEKLDLKSLEEARASLGLLGFKYVRKFVATKLVELGCSQLEIDFIQGRAPRSVLESSYANVLVAADNCYKRYAGWLRGFLSTP